MSSAGLKPSAAITRGMTDTQAAMVNSRWFRHSAAGVRLAAGGPGPRGQRAGVPGDLRRPQPEAPLPPRRAGRAGPRRGRRPCAPPLRWLVPRSVNDFPPPGT